MGVSLKMFGFSVEFYFFIAKFLQEKKILSRDVL